MNKFAVLLAATALFSLSACSSERVSHFPSYKLKVIQGNQLDARAVSSLRPGMSRDQVQLLLGTPLLRSAFHQNRWDYTYEISRNGIINQAETRNLTVWFENDRLVKAEGNAVDYAREQLQAATQQPQQ
ncbi:outer membrane protein assembly factor BamE [Neisseria sp. 23W00296]|uniref:outer membrane protein assembly factor BamE n=1 Tax=unclassified Neisseria TaxID=2623750 RepID=UPI0037563E8B